MTLHFWIHRIPDVSEVVSQYKSNSTNVYCAALDLSKAYDKINHDILITKLIDAKLPMSIVKIFQYMLSHTDVCVRFKAMTGQSWRVKNGVRQGGCTSSILFAFYINEILENLKSIRVGCQLKGEKMNIVAFADDIFLLCPSKSGLQVMVNHISKLFNDLCLKLNTDKSKYIVFRHKKNIFTGTLGTILLNGLPLEKVSKLKYLGIYLSEDFDIKADCDRALKMFLKQFNAMYQKFSFLSTNVLSFLFKTYTSSFYGINLWFEQNLRNSLTRKLEISYHKAVKKVMKLEMWRSNHNACEQMGVDLFKHLLSKRLLTFYFATINSNCKMISKLKYHFMLSSQLYNSLKNRFRQLYQINDVIGNDKNALIARVYFVQRTEPRSTYVYEPD